MRILQIQAAALARCGVGAALVGAVAAGCTGTGEPALVSIPAPIESHERARPEPESMCASARAGSRDAASGHESVLGRVQRTLAFETTVSLVRDVVPEVPVIEVPGWSFYRVHVDRGRSPRSCWVGPREISRSLGFSVICDGQLLTGRALIDAIERERGEQQSALELATLLAVLDGAEWVYTGSGHVPARLRDELFAPRLHEEDGKRVVEWVERLRPKANLVLLVRVSAKLFAEEIDAEREELATWEPGRAP